MSASKKKKLRLEQVDLSEQQAQAAEQAAAAKRKNTLYAVIAIIAAVAIAALLFWDSGLVQKKSVALTINGRDFTPGEVSYYYGTIREQYSAYLPYIGYDYSLSDREQMWDTAAGQSFYDLFMADAKGLMIQTTSLADAARKAGVTLNEESRTLVNDTIETYKSLATQYGYPYESFLIANFGKYMTPALLESCLEESALSNQFYNDYLSTLSYDDSDYLEYYKTKADTLDTVVYDVCFISGSPAAKLDAEGKTVEPTEWEKTTAMESAKKLAEELSSSTSFAVQASLAANQNDYSYFNPSVRTQGSNISLLYQEWLLDDARKEGDMTIAESVGSGYYVVRFVDRFLDEEAFSTAGIRHILIMASVEDGATAPTVEAMAAAKEEAQALLDEFAIGAKTGEAFGALAKEYSADPGSKDNGGLYEGVTRSTNFFTAFLDWIFADGRKVGDTGLVENTQDGQQGWHVMYLDSAEGMYWKESAKNALLTADINEWLDGLMASYEAVEGAGMKYVG